MKSNHRKKKRKRKNNLSYKPNSTISSQSDPVRDWLVLLEFHSQSTLRAKCLLGRLKIQVIIRRREEYKNASEFFDY